MNDRIGVWLLSALLALLARLNLGAATAAMASMVDGGMNTITAPGDDSFTLAHGGLTRAYLVHVPRGYQPASPAPLLVAFHGGGGNMRFQADDEHDGRIRKSESANSMSIRSASVSPACSMAAC